MGLSQRWTKILVVALPGLLAVACEDTSKPAVAPAAIAVPADVPEPPAQAKRSPLERTRSSGSALRQSAERWRASHETECPTAARLEEEKALAPDASATDAWGTPFRIICDDDDETIVVSLGPDKLEGTNDDVRDHGEAASAKPKGAPPGAARNAPGAVAGSTWGAADAVKVVRAHTPAVKRACWDNDAGAQPSNASVTLTLSIAPDGSVQNESASGTEPMASCVARDAKSWVFAPPGTGTTVNIPFKFVRQ